jgi:hypothetical protein
MPQSICRTFRDRDPPKMIAWLGARRTATQHSRQGATRLPHRGGAGREAGTQASDPELDAPIRLELVGATTFKTGTVARDFRSA